MHDHYTGSAASSTRGIISGGYSPSSTAVQNLIQYNYNIQLGDAKILEIYLQPDDGGHAYACNSTRGLLMVEETPS